MQNSIFNNWAQPEFVPRLELVFENRNQSYGAYQIRKNYHRTKALALFISVALFAGSAYSAFLWYRFHPKPVQNGNIKEEVPSVTVIHNLPKTPKVLLPELNSKPTQRLKTDCMVPPVIDPETASNYHFGLNENIFRVGEENNAGGSQFVPGLDPGPSNFWQPTEEQEEKVYDNPDSKAVFVDAEFNTFESYVVHNFKITPDCGENSIQVEFVMQVNEFGQISKLQVAKGALGCKEAEAEVLRILQSTNGKWIPAVHHGKAVKSYCKVPVTINIGVN